MIEKLLTVALWPYYLAARAQGAVLYALLELGELFRPGAPERERARVLRS